MKIKTGQTLLAAAFFSCLLACVKNPDAPELQQINAAEHSVLVLNEGLWGRDNASISRYDPESKTTEHNVFQRQNPGLRLGDTANSWTVAGDRIYVVMNGSNTIEVLDRHSLVSLGRILLPGNPSPRHLVISGGNTGYVTALYDDAVLQLDLEHKLFIEAIAVGPAPEGLAISGDFLFVCNSGLGDIRANEAGAGTLSIIDLTRNSEIAQIPVLPNCNSLEIGPDGLLYIGGSGSWVSDQPSGLVIFDPARFAVLDTILIPHHPRDFAFDGIGSAFVLTDSAVVKISMFDRSIMNHKFISSASVSPGNYFYAIAIDRTHEELFLSNARNFTTNGEVTCFDFSGREKFRFPTRILPGAILIQ